MTDAQRQRLNALRSVAMLGGRRVAHQFEFPVDSAAVCPYCGLVGSEFLEFIHNNDFHDLRTCDLQEFARDRCASARLTKSYTYCCDEEELCKPS